MYPLYLLLVPLLLGFFATFSCMPWLLRLCLKRGLYDQPNERKVHTTRIPRLGGLLFAPSMILAMSCGALCLQWDNPNEESIAIRFSTLLLFAGLLINYSVGILDDIFGVRALMKFAVQIGTSLLFPLCGLYINNLYGLFGIEELPIWASYPLTVLTCLLIVNAYNLIDGIDGLAATLALTSLAAFALMFWQLHVLSYTFLALSLMGSLLAFLYFNLWGKAERGTKTFMGDTGSLVIGYTLTYFALKCAMHNPCILSYRPDGFLLALALVFVPVFDLIRVALTRLSQHKGMFSPDRSHIHHICMDAGYSMRQSLFLIVGLQLALVAMSWCTFHLLNLSPTLILCFQLLLFSSFILWITHKHKPSLP